jgi:ArsR family transcriptional regulator, arsenate/arsenite/antimonite-responsive transcriptional repressor
MYMNEVVRWGKAFADTARIRIVAALQSGELCVCELVDALEMSQSTLSSHLQMLRQAGIVTTRKDGKWSYYALAPAHNSLIEALFQHYAHSLETDARLQRDIVRLRQRLAARDNGRCVLSFVQLDIPEKGGVLV